MTSPFFVTSLRDLFLALRYSLAGGLGLGEFSRVLMGVGEWLEGGNWSDGFLGSEAEKASLLMININFNEKIC